VIDRGPRLIPPAKDVILAGMAYIEDTAPVGVHPMSMGFMPTSAVSVLVEIVNFTDEKIFSICSKILTSDEMFSPLFVTVRMFPAT
jgi:hypothetical protein